MNWPAFLTRKSPLPKLAPRGPALAQKTSAAGPVIAYAQVGKPKWTPRRYDALAEEGYRKNVVAWRCITEVARASSSIPWLLYDEAHHEVDQHPLLALLKNPNPLQGTAQFLESVFSYYQIAGNVYIEAIRPNERDAPVELFVLRPDRMRIIPGPRGLPQGYEYQVGGQTTRWSADPISGESNILHWKAFHPLDDWYGMAPLEAAMTAIDQHNSASAWNQALLNQAARPSGALIYAPKDGPSQLSDEQFRRLREELEEHYQTPRNAGRPLILEGGLDWKEMGLTPKDMDWLAGRKRAAQDIALAFGVPDQLIGISEAQTYSNMAEARLSLYEETVLPLVQQFKGELNRWLAPMFDARLQLDIDVDRIPALAARRDVLWEKLNKVDFITRDEKRVEVGYAPDTAG